jgi:hypothetical protein
LPPKRAPPRIWAERRQDRARPFKRTGRAS